MTSVDSPSHERLAKRRWYRRGYYGSILAGVAGLFLAVAVGYPLVGIGLYWVGAFGMFAFLWATPIELFDEREQTMEQRTSATTLQVLAVVLIVAAPGLVALEEAAIYEAPPILWGAVWGYVALYGLFAAVGAFYRYRP